MLGNGIVKLEETQQNSKQREKTQHIGMDTHTNTFTCGNKLCYVYRKGLQFVRKYIHIYMIHLEEGRFFLKKAFSIEIACSMFSELGSQETQSGGQ